MSTQLKEKCILHSYQRSKTRKNIYKCIAPRCNHYIDAEFLEHKEALCTKCHRPFILDRMQLKNKMTVCILCSKSPRAKEAQAAQEAMSEILMEINKPILESPERKDNLND